MNRIFVYTHSRLKSVFARKEAMLVSSRLETQQTFDHQHDHLTGSKTSHTHTQKIFARRLVSMVSHAINSIKYQLYTERTVKSII